MNTMIRTFCWVAIFGVLAVRTGQSNMTQDWGQLDTNTYWVKTVVQATAGQSLQLVIQGIQPERDSFKVRVSGSPDNGTNMAYQMQELGFVYMYGFGSAMNAAHQIPLGQTNGGVMIESPGLGDTPIPLHSISLRDSVRLIVRFEVLGLDDSPRPDQAFVFKSMHIEALP